MSSYTQTKFIDESKTRGDLETKDYFRIYYKSVSIENTQSEDISNNQNRKIVLNVLNSLPSSDKLNFEKLNITTNQKLWIDSLLTSINEDNVKYLLNDFTNDMNTNMKEKDKYAILIILDSELILVHTKMGEKAISPKFKIFDRMLDKDNIMRYAWFKKTEGDIKVTYYEKYQSKFFSKWLGINRKDLFYEFGGKNNFYLELHGYPLVLEIDDEDFEDNDFFEFKNNEVLLKEPPEGLKINHIQRLSKRYENISEFKKDHTSRRFNLKYHQEKYRELMNSLIPLQNKIYDYETCVKSTNGKYSLQKKNTNLTILFCNDKIEIDDDFLDTIILSIINNAEIELCHAGLTMIEPPIRIGKLNLYNKLDLNLANPLISYYNDTEFSPSHKKEFLYAIFHCLYIDNKNSLYSYFLEKCSEKLSERLTFSSNIYENDIVELKSRDFVMGENENIINNLSEDIRKKLEENDLKFYILGYDEKNKVYEPVQKDRYGDSRIDYLTKKIKEKTKLNNVVMFKVGYDDKNCILALIVKK